MMGLFFDTPELPNETTPSGVVWFIYMGLAALIWLIFVWDESFIPALLSSDTRAYLVDLARFFPGPNGRFESLVEHGYADVARNYSVYFSINFLLFIGFYIFTFPIIWNDNKCEDRMKKYNKIGTIILVGGGVMFIVLFIMKFIDFDQEKPFVNYEIHKGSAYYYIDLIVWSGLFVFVAALPIKLKIAFRMYIWGEK